MKILVGSLLFVAILALATYLHRPLFAEAIESDLSRKVARVLAEEDLPPSAATFDGHGLSLQEPVASSLSPAGYQKLDGIIGVYISTPKDSPEPSANPQPPTPVLDEPRLFVQEEDESQFTLSGNLASEAQSKELIAALETVEPPHPSPILTKVTASQETAALKGLPSLLNLLVEHMQSTEQAGLQYQDRTLKLTGIVETKEDEERILAAAAPFLTGDRTLDNQLKVVSLPPYNLQLQRDNGTITLQGLFPSPETREETLSLIRENCPDERLIDNSTLASRHSSSTWWQDHLTELLPDFLSQTEGPLHLHYGAVNLEASATFLSKSAKNDALGQLSELPAELTLDLDLNHRDPSQETVAMAQEVPVQPEPPAVGDAKMEVEPEPEAQALSQNLKLFPVYFDTSSDTIKPEEERKIKDAAQAILSSKAQNQTLTVGGYADLRGNADFNRTLSLKRAGAVRKSLIALGVNPDRLVINHFGEDTSESDPADLWKARRVEISLTPLQP